MKFFKFTVICLFPFLMVSMNAAKMNWNVYESNIHFKICNTCDQHSNSRMQKDASCCVMWPVWNRMISKICLPKMKRNWVTLSRKNTRRTFSLWTSTLCRFVHFTPCPTRKIQNCPIPMISLSAGKKFCRVPSVFMNLICLKSEPRSGEFLSRILNPMLILFDMVRSLTAVVGLVWNVWSCCFWDCRIFVKLHGSLVIPSVSRLKIIKETMN
mmetsp:Transcript_9352/g.12407  ORF Transcript_9352/g.12407 Transcript_9352/m.12407 type:complete len:212 (-) Transcript_9352:132-767(-)